MAVARGQLSRDDRPRPQETVSAKVYVEMPYDTRGFSRSGRHAPEPLKVQFDNSKLAAAPYSAHTEEARYFMIFHLLSDLVGFKLDRINKSPVSALARGVGEVARVAAGIEAVDEIREVLRIEVLANPRIFNPTQLRYGGDTEYSFEELRSDLMEKIFILLLQKNTKLTSGDSAFTRKVLYQIDKDYCGGAFEMRLAQIRDQNATFVRTVEDLEGGGGGTTRTLMHALTPVRWGGGGDHAAETTQGGRGAGANGSSGRPRPEHPAEANSTREPGAGGGGGTQAPKFRPVTAGAGANGSAPQGIWEARQTVNATNRGRGRSGRNTP
jgi:hypothetical protein